MFKIMKKGKVHGAEGMPIPKLKFYPLIASCLVPPPTSTLQIKEQSVLLYYQQAARLSLRNPKKQKRRCQTEKGRHVPKKASPNLILPGLHIIVENSRNAVLNFHLK